MFTGIITDIGRIAAIQNRDEACYTINTMFDSKEIQLGASICCSGVCLTVIAKGETANQHWFSVQVSAATLSCTTLREWQVGSEINLERSLKLGDEFGGHIVTGHVDGVGEVESITPVGESHILRFKIPDLLTRYVVKKGSIAVDGVSLTVNEIDGDIFTVNIIPHSWEKTIIRNYVIGSSVNIEIDMIARYAEKLLTRS